MTAFTITCASKGAGTTVRKYKGKERITTPSNEQHGLAPDPPAASADVM
jgi:hypothetical protein